MSLVCRWPVRPAGAATGRSKSLIYLNGEYMQRDTVFLWLWAIWTAFLICGAAYVLMQ
jgi:hypothetical protein